MKYLFLFCSLWIAHWTAAQEISEETKIYLMTCSPGIELSNTFGHTGIRVFDPANDLDVVFNYGLYDFDIDGFYLKFLRGQLLYQFGAHPMDRFLQSYKRMKRSIYQQELNLDYTQVQSLYHFLIENYKPENRSYKYDFFFDNCATRPRDAFEDVLEIQYAKDQSNKSFRDILDEYLVSMPWSDFGIDLIIGSIADKKADLRAQMFIPEYLHDHFSTAHIGNKSLVLKEDLLLDFIAINNERRQAGIFTPFLFFGLLLLMEIFLLFNRNKKFVISWYDRYNKFCLFVLGLGGCIVAFMWFGTEHIATKANWNLLWLHPLYLGSLFLYGNKRHWVHWLNASLLLLSLLAFYFLPQRLHFCVVILLIIFLLKYYYLLLKKDDPNLLIA